MNNVFRTGLSSDTAYNVIWHAIGSSVNYLTTPLDFPARDIDNEVIIVPRFGWKCSIDSSSLAAYVNDVENYANLPMVCVDGIVKLNWMQLIVLSDQGFYLEKFHKHIIHKKQYYDYVLKSSNIVTMRKANLLDIISIKNSVNDVDDICQDKGSIEINPFILEGRKLLLDEMSDLMIRSDEKLNEDEEDDLLIKMKDVSTKSEEFGMSFDSIIEHETQKFKNMRLLS